MRAWLVTVGEPLPIDRLDRLFRAGMLAEFLLARGHEVTWWTSTFDHVRKRHRFDRDTTIEVREGYHIKLLHSLGYQKNVSLRRIFDHRGIARRFAQQAPLEPRPDVILCSLPTIELSLAATRYGKQAAVPVIVDVRDQWPDLFLELAPPWARRVARFIFTPLFREVRAACAEATAIIGVTQAFVEWGLRYAGRPCTDLDRDFPFAYGTTPPSPDAIASAKTFWEGLGISDVKDRGFIVCFFGALGRQFELETVIAAAQDPEVCRRAIRFVLCGTGESLERYRRLARGCRNVLLPGWVGAAEIWTLLRMSTVGLAPYRNRENFIHSLPNKPVEYLSAGLPVVSSLKGVLRDLLETHGCGATYEEGDARGLASLLVSLHDRPERLRAMSEKAKALFDACFAVEKVYGEMVDYLEKVATLSKAGISDPRSNHV